MAFFEACLYILGNIIESKLPAQNGTKPDNFLLLKQIIIVVKAKLGCLAPHPTCTALRPCRPGALLSF